MAQPSPSRRSRSTAQYRPRQEKEASQITGVSFAISSAVRSIIRARSRRSPSRTVTSTKSPKRPMARSPTSLPTAIRCCRSSSSTRSSGRYFCSQGIFGHCQRLQYLDLERLSDMLAPPALIFLLFLLLLLLLQLCLFYPNFGFPIQRTANIFPVVRFFFFTLNYLSANIFL